MDLKQIFEAFKDGIKCLDKVSFNARIKFHVDFDYVNYMINILIENKENKKVLRYYIREKDVEMLRSQESLDSYIYRMFLNAVRYLDILSPKEVN